MHGVGSNCQISLQMILTQDAYNRIKHFINYTEWKKYPNKQDQHKVNISNNSNLVFHSLGTLGTSHGKHPEKRAKTALIFCWKI